MPFSPVTIIVVQTSAKYYMHVIPNAIHYKEHVISIRIVLLTNFRTSRSGNSNLIDK